MTAAVKSRSAKKAHATLREAQEPDVIVNEVMALLSKYVPPMEVRTDAKGKKHEGISILLVEKEPGDHFAPPKLSGDPIPTIGYKGMNSYNVAFDGYEVPAENLLGGVEGQGFKQLMATYEYARIQTAARAVGVAQAAFDAALQYSKDRIQFDRPISEFQVIRHKLVDMATQVEVSREFTYRVAAKMNSGLDQVTEVSMAKNFACQVSDFVTYEAVQIFGGYGYMREYLVERLYRDNRILSIGGGTTEIMKEIIARRIL